MRLGRKAIVWLTIVSAAVIGAVPAYRYWKREYGPLDNSAALAAWQTWQGPKYSRSECMVRLTLESGPGSEKAWEALFPTFTRYVYNHEPKALFDLGWDRQGRMYLQFFEECPRRYEIARAMAGYFERRYGAAIRFTVADDLIQPGPETIQACGQQWLDCGTPPEGWRAQPR